MNLSPIALFVYNRPKHTLETIEALQKNEYASESELFIFSDGPKNRTAERSVNEVRKYVESVCGFKKITIIKRNENWGLSRSIIGGVSEVVQKYCRVIVLEDDLVTSPFFLKYMNEFLEYYEDDDRVISVHGWMWPTLNNMKFSPFFLRGADCWGWATWKRGWEFFEPDGKKLRRQLVEKKLVTQFDFNDQGAFFQMLKDQIAGKNDSWAVRWYASAFLQNKLTMHPGISLVQNIGIDNSGTNCVQSDFFQVPLASESVDCKIFPIEEDNNMRIEAEQYYRRLKPMFLKRFISKIKRVIYGIYKQLLPNK